MDNTDEMCLTMLTQAEKTLLDAKEIMNRGGKPKFVVKRTYYSMIYGVLSLLANDGIELESSDHSNLIALFREKYIVQGKTDLQLYELLQNVFYISERSDAIENVDSYLLGPNLAGSILSGGAHFLDFVRSNLETHH